jgi:hypothetical protein
MAWSNATFILLQWVTMPGNGLWVAALLVYAKCKISLMINSSFWLTYIVQYTPTLYWFRKSLDNQRENDAVANCAIRSLNARSSVKASLTSSGHNTSRSLPAASPIVITRTRNFEVSGAQESLPGKNEYVGDALVCPEFLPGLTCFLTLLRPCRCLTSAVNVTMNILSTRADRTITRATALLHRTYCIRSLHLAPLCNCQY